VCGPCTEKADGHHKLRHVAKDKALECDHCGHQDVVIDDFCDHLSAKHDVAVDLDFETAGYTVATPRFTRLSYCHTCGWRNSSANNVKVHKAARHPPPPGFAPRSGPRVAISAGLARPLLAPPSAFITPRHQLPPIAPHLFRNNGGYQQRAIVARNDNIHEDRARVALRRQPFPVFLWGDVVPNKPGVTFYKVRVYMSCEPTPGLYGIQGPGGVAQMTICYHAQDLRWSQNPTSFVDNAREHDPYMAFMMTAHTTPASLTIKAYFNRLLECCGAYDICRYDSSDRIGSLTVDATDLYSC